VAADIAANAIGNSELASNAVQSVNIADNTITGADILNLTITAADIAANAITNSELASNAVQSVNIANGSIVNADVSGSAAIAGTKISPNFGTQNIATTGNLTLGSTYYTSYNGGQIPSLVAGSNFGSLIE